MLLDLPHAPTSFIAQVTAKEPPSNLDGEVKARRCAAVEFLPRHLEDQYVRGEL